MAIFQKIANTTLSDVVKGSFKLGTKAAHVTLSVVNKTAKTVATLTEQEKEEKKENKS